MNSGYRPDQSGVWLDYAGDSMSPRLKDGYKILLERADLKSLKEGSIIAFKSISGGLVIHRLISKADGRLITKADNNPYLDTYMPVDRLAGKISKIKKGGDSPPVAIHGVSLAQLFLGKMLLFGRNGKNSIPAFLHPFLERSFYIFHRLLRLFA